MGDPIASRPHCLYAQWGRMVRATINDRLGVDLNDHDAVIAAFESHNAAVRRAFDEDRLLVFEASQGWEPLCRFLDCKQPDDPFPNVNSKAEFDGVFDLLRSPLGPRVMSGEGIEAASLHDEVFNKL